MLKPEMKKPMIIMLSIVGTLFGLIFIYKLIVALFMKSIFEKNHNPTFTVSAVRAVKSDWYPHLESVGSLRAIVGVNVTAQLGGMIQDIYFTPGVIIQQGEKMVQQNADPDIAQLHALEANEKLAQITYDRDKLQYQVNAVSKQQLDSDLQNLKSLQAQVAQQKATIAKLTIRAPFTGRLGISKVNPGQYLNPGDTVTTLQSLDPIYVDFYLPQQALSQLKMDQVVTLTSDTYPDITFTGKITTINPLVETSTRNVEVEATVENPKYLLIPGMFANVSVKTAGAKALITLGQTAVSFNAYGDIVYVITQQGVDDKKHPILVVHQEFVTVGDTRGDQVAILSGVKEGDIIVTSGQLKLRNGSRVVINNSVQPGNSSNPTVTNEHGDA